MAWWYAGARFPIKVPRRAGVREGGTAKQLEEEEAAKAGGKKKPQRRRKREAVEPAGKKTPAGLQPSAPPDGREELDRLRPEKLAGNRTLPRGRGRGGKCKMGVATRIGGCAGQDLP